jgi:hypothetical protein
VSSAECPTRSLFSRVERRLGAQFGAQSPVAALRADTRARRSSRCCPCRQRGGRRTGTGAPQRGAKHRKSKRIMLCERASAPLRCARAPCADKLSCQSAKNCARLSPARSGGEQRAPAAKRRSPVSYCCPSGHRPAPLSQLAVQPIVSSRLSAANCQQPTSGSARAVRMKIGSPVITTRPKLLPHEDPHQSGSCHRLVLVEWCRPDRAANVAPLSLREGERSAEAQLHQRHRDSLHPVPEALERGAASLDHLRSAEQIGACPALSAPDTFHEARTGRRVT